MIKLKSELEQIPGIGKSIAFDLIELGYPTIESLKNKDPENLYNKLNEYKGYIVDRCMLYVFRCAIYYASNEEYDEKLLKWWNWKDK